MDKCQELYAASNNVLTDNQFCAIGHNGIGPCQGDSGGILLILKIINKKKHNSNFYLTFYRSIEL